jgi:hypothetical protein
MDREDTIKAFSNLDTVTDLVYAAYVEKPTKAETVEPNAWMVANTLETLAARNVPLRHIVLACDAGVGGDGNRDGLDDETLFES